MFDIWDDVIKRIEVDPKAKVIANGKCYYYDRRRPISNAPASSRGFGGAVFKIKYYDGEIAETNDLYFNGNIPENYRDKLPDNATIEQL